MAYMMAYMTEDDIDTLRQDIDKIDAQIVNLIRERTASSRQIGRIRAHNGGPRIIPEREVVVRKQYEEFGPQGEQIISSLFELGRGPHGPDEG
jgi:chorismate mutase